MNFFSHSSVRASLRLILLIVYLCSINCYTGYYVPKYFLCYRYFDDNFRLVYIANLQYYILKKNNFKVIMEWMFFKLKFETKLCEGTCMAKNQNNFKNMYM